MTKEECIALLNRYAEYNGMGIPNLAGCREAMRTAAELLQRPSLPSNLDEAELKHVEFSDYPPANQEEELMVYNAFKAGAEWQLNEDSKKHYFAQLKNIKDAWRELKKINPEIKSKPALCFYKGAEWMAGQGVNAVSGVCKLADRAWVTPIDEKKFTQDVFDNFVAGDKVVVQIRKKQ